MILIVHAFTLRRAAFITWKVLTVAACVLFVVTTHAATITTFAGTGVKGFSGDGGPASAAQLNNPFAVARGPDGALYICDVDNQRIRRVTADGKISTCAGSGQRGYSGDGGSATNAALNEPYEMAWDKAGNLFFVERLNHLVRRVDAKSGVISTVAGTGKLGFSGDGGAATTAQFNQPHSLAFDAVGDLYICDVLNHRIRKIDLKTGTVSTWAGTGEKKTAPDGSPITGSALHGPRALAFAPDGKCWLALREGNALLALDPKANTIKRIAGTGKSGFTGNGGPALAATLAGPKCVALDAAGNVHLADTESHSIRYLDVKRGTLEVLVGNGRKGDGPDGNDPLNCQLARPHGVFVDADGSIYIGDSETHRVRVWRK
jgi:streptogramin lyase